VHKHVNKLIDQRKKQQMIDCIFNLENSVEKKLGKNIAKIANDEICQKKEKMKNVLVR